MRKALVCAAIAVLLISGYALAQELKSTVVVRQDIPSFVGYVPGQMIVTFKNISERSVPPSPVTGRAQVGVTSLDALGEKFGVSKVEPLFPGAAPKVMKGRAFDLSRHHRITFDENLNLDDVLAAYRSDPNVESAEPIGIHTVQATPNDGYYSQQWHLNQSNDKDVDAPQAWDIETGDASVIVAMMDTGVRYFHKDLGGSNASYANPTGADGNMWINWAEKNGTAGVDDDANGFVDDWVGYDWVTGVTGCWSGEDCSTADNDPRDFNGHGTHCAGNIAAMNNNGYATCAVSGGWLGGTQQPTGNGVKVMACRIGWSGSYLGYEVGYVRMDFAASALYYAADNGAKIASCSWGSSNSGGIAAAIDYFIAAGGIICKAAGNDGSQTADYMCGRTDIISVAASDSNDCKADFSTYGTWVDVSAPGTGILSSYHDHTAPANDYVAWMDGTSMATPIAASVAALIWSKNLTWTAAEVRNRLQTTADPIDGLACNSSYAGKLGAGRVNAYNAVAGGCVAPVANFSASPVSGYVPLTVQFTDLSSGGPTSWLWDFGDGGSSTLQNPSHQYQAVGLFTVTLTATNSCGSDQEVKTGFISVMEQPAQQCDDFNDGNLTGWTNISGTWTATGGYMKGNSKTTDTHITSPFGTFGAATVDVDVRMNAGQTQRKARVVFAFTNSRNYRFIEGDDVANTWRIYQRVNGRNTSLASVSRTINTAQWYHVHIAAASDGNVTLYVDGVSAGSYKFAAAVTGAVGCGYNRSNSDFDNFCVGANGTLALAGGSSPLMLSQPAPVKAPSVSYPNPFRSATTISFNLDEPAHVVLEVYNVAGQRVKKLVDEMLPSGQHGIPWNGTADDGSKVSSGVYFYRIAVNGSETVKGKIIMMK